MLLIFAIILGIFFFREDIKDFFGSSSPDIHEDILSECISKDNGSSYSCYAFLDNYEKRDSKECFSFSIITKDYNIKTKTYCYEDGYVNWEKEEMISEKSVPVYFDISYKPSITGNRVLKSVSLKLLEDSITFDLINKFYDNGYVISNVLTREIAEIDKKGFYTRTFPEEPFNNTVGSVIFRSAEVKSFSIENSEFKLQMEIRVNDKEILINTVISKLFMLDLTDGNSIPTEINELDVNRKYDIGALYFPKGEITFNSGVCSTSTYSDYPFPNLCSNIKNLNIENMQISIDDYLSTLSPEEENNADKLLFFLFINNE